MDIMENKSEAEEKLSRGTYGLKTSQNPEDLGSSVEAEPFDFASSMLELRYTCMSLLTSFLSPTESKSKGDLPEV